MQNNSSNKLTIPSSNNGIQLKTRSRKNSTSKISNSDTKDKSNKVQLKVKKKSCAREHSLDKKIDESNINELNTHNISKGYSKSCRNIDSDNKKSSFNEIYLINNPRITKLQFEEQLKDLARKTTIDSQDKYSNNLIKKEELEMEYEFDFSSSDSAESDNQFKAYQNSSNQEKNQDTKFEDKNDKSQ